MQQLQYENIYKSLPPKSSSEDVWSLDLELSGLKDSQLHRPFGRLTSLAGTKDGKDVYIIFEESEVQQFLDSISESTWVFHNSVFDLGHLRRWSTITERKNLRDTLLIERLLYSNYYSDFGLNHLVRRYLGLYMPKDIRKEFHDLEGAMTEEQIQYAALDVIGTWLVDKEQQKVISDVDKKIWDNLYNPHVWTTLELGGFKLDVDAWIAIADRNQSVVDALSEKLSTKYGIEKTKLVGRGKARHEEKYFEPFNLNSPAQVKSVLKTNFKLDLESTDDDHIRPFYETNEFVRDILDFRRAEQGVSKYGLPFLKNVEEDGRIYTSLNIALASTGRDSSSSPALQNIEGSKERRSCFIAGEGKVLVLYDYSGQEANLFAYNTQDPLLIDIINSGKKLYLEVAKMAFDEIVVKDSPRYKIIKALVLGLMYGLTPYGFARDNGVSKEVAEEMFERFFDAFPTAAQWIHSKQARNMGVSKTVIGRSIHLHPYDNQWKNNSLNDPQQGSAGDMIKLAMKGLRKTDFYKTYHPDNKVNLILQVHDEIITEVAKELAEEWDPIMRNKMISVAESLHPGIKGGVSGGIITDWSQKS